MPSTGPSIRVWNPSLRSEPNLRVGIVLDEDRAATLPVTILAEAVLLEAESEPAIPLPHGAITFRKVDDAVAIRTNGGSERTSRIWSLSQPAPPSPLTAGSIIVRDVIAGRGFHWQKRIDQRLPGSVEIRAGQSGLILINHVPLETYLGCVITSEMSGDCPGAFLHAQCIVARSWLLAMSEDKHPQAPFDRCNDDCCQRYHGSADQTSAAIDTVNSTRGIALTAAGGDVVDANYSKCCGGISEAPETVWGQPKAGISVVTDAPPESAARRFRPVTDNTLAEYLTGSWIAETDIYCSPNVVSPDAIRRYLGRVDEAHDYFRWQHRIERQALEHRLQTHVEQLRQLAQVTDLKPGGRGPSGRASELTICYMDTQHRPRRFVLNGELVIRMLLSEKTLYSSAFRITAESDTQGRPQAFLLDGAGWGHGVGLCQMGGLGMALAGRTCGQLLAHYFPGARQERLYE